MIFWNIYDIFFFSTVIPVYPMNKHECGRSESLRGRQKFGTNRKKCSTNVKHRHVGINRRLIVQFNSNPRIQRLQNGHTNYSASGWRATTTVLNMRFLFMRHSLHVCTWFTSALPALFVARVTKRNENVKKEVILWAQQQLCSCITFSNFFVVHAQLRHRITKYDSVAIGYVTWTRIFFKPHTFFPQIHLPSTRNK